MLKRIVFLAIGIYFARSFEGCLSFTDFTKKYTKNIKSDISLTNMDNDKDIADLNPNITGKGGFGVVYKCSISGTPSQGHVPAVIKVIDYNTTKIIQKGEVQSAKAEIEKEKKQLRLLYRISPVHFIKFHACFYNKERMFFITEGLDSSLDGKIFTSDSTNRLLLEEKIGLSLMIAKSIAKLHSLYKAHLDIKPNNFVIAKKNGINIIKLIDYGLIQHVGESSVGGTPGFIDPRIAERSTYRVNTLSDVYSLGATFHVLLYGYADAYIAREKYFFFFKYSAFA